ncbi:MAG: hypothetical protein COA50_08760 [Flavobacteriaceae bacterium]|nr:MAG: hypothetical protein COA50_08760 [Flavobacteriaceae bacterium]
MGQVLNTITIAMTFLTVLAFTNNPIIKKELPDTNSSISNQFGVNINTIMDDISRNSKRYYVAGTMTVLTDQANQFPSTHLNISMERTRIIYQRGRDYIQANTIATYRELFNDVEDEIKIYIHRDSDPTNKEDVKSIKINWKNNSRETVGVLTNITAFYESGGMLLTGTFQKGNQSFGISLAITQ